MTNPDELLRLAERVEQGSGDDHHLRHAIYNGLGGIALASHPILTSVDAVEVLRDKLEIGGTLISVGGGKTWKVSIMFDHVDFDGDAPTEARARLAALLRVYASALNAAGSP